MRPKICKQVACRGPKATSGATSQTFSHLGLAPRGCLDRSRSGFETTSRLFQNSLIGKISEPPDRRAQGSALAQAVEAYRRHEEARGVTPLGAHQAIVRLSRFVAFCHRRRITDPVRVTPRLVLAFLDDLRTSPRRSRPSLEGPLAATTCRNIFGQLVRFFEFLVRIDRLLLNPAASLVFMRQAEPAPGPWVTEDQMGRLVECVATLTSPVGRRDRAILEVLFGCGLRLAELVALDVDDVDFRSGLVRVRRGKGGRGRLVPIAGEALHALGAYVSRGRGLLAGDAGERALFLAQGGARLAAVSVFVRIKRLVRCAGLPAAVSPHAFRRGFATALLRGGADIASVAKLLGHEKLATTQWYTFVDLADLRRVHRKTHPRERGR